MATKSYWTRFEKARVSRRRLLGAVGTGAAGVALVAACGGGDGNGGAATATPAGPEATATPSAAAPVRGGTYITTNTVDWGTIDPVTSVAAAPGIFPRIYNVLIERSRRDPNFVFEDLAESLPEQPDEETYIYTIRAGVKIGPNSLGIPERDLDSGDAVSWLERIRDDSNAVHGAFSQQWLRNFEAPDAASLIIRTIGPYAYFLLRLGSPLGGTMPPREFAEQEISLEADGVGAGPFIIKPGSFRATGDIVLLPNPNYYRTGSDGNPLPYIDEYQVKLVPDRQARRAAFISDQISAYGAEDADEVEEIRRQVPGMSVFEDPANTFISFTMNPTRPPWDNADIRKAAMFALNRQQFVDLIVGPDGGQINGLVHWSVGDFALPPDELEQLQPFDPERSRALIRQATGEDTIKIKVIWTEVETEFIDKHFPIWKEQMEAAGFDLDMEALDFGSWLDQYTRVEYDASFSLNQIYETPEVPLDFHAAQGPQGDGNFAIGIGALFPEIEAMITASKATTDPEEQIALVRDAQRAIYEAGPAYLPIMTWNAFTLRQPSVKNWPQGLGASELYLNDWWIDTA